MTNPQPSNPRPDRPQIPRTSQLLVSACLIVRNEETYLPRCLGSLRGLADEIVIVDTGSTDRTVEIAESFGAHVSRQPWENDFSLHRNQSMDMARGKWLFIVDADEELVDTDIAETRQNLARDDLPPLLMVRSTLVYPASKRIDVLAPRFVLRASGIRYVHPVHEQLEVADCPALLSNVTLMHHGYATPGAVREKEARNLVLARRMPPGPHAWHCMARAAHSLGDWATVLEAGTCLADAADAPAVMRVEACVLAGTAAFNLHQDERLDALLAQAQALAPDAPDVCFLDLLAAGRRYLSSLADGDASQPGTFFRPWTFWHNREQWALLLDVLLGRKALVHRAGDAAMVCMNAEDAGPRVEPGGG